jgi:hypothetical protein
MQYLCVAECMQEKECFHAKFGVQTNEESTSTNKTASLLLTTQIANAGLPQGSYSS